MSFLRQIFGLQAKNLSKTHTRPSAAASTAGSQRELLRLVLGNTLTRHGIPPEWIGAEMLRATLPDRKTGIHLRLLIRHWDPRLLPHTVALQNSLIVRLLTFDVDASKWLMGVSWQFALPDESACPPMPQPGWWTAEAQPDQGEIPVAASAASAPSAAIRSDLERLLAIRDNGLAATGQGEAGGTAATQPAYTKTQPFYLQTQPMGLDDLQPAERDA